MNKLISIVLVCITLMSTGVLAHSDHAHGYINDQQAISIAAKSIKKLTFKDLVDFPNISDINCSAHVSLRWFPKRLMLKLTLIITIY